MELLLGPRDADDPPPDARDGLFDRDVLLFSPGVVTSIIRGFRSGRLPTMTRRVGPGPELLPVPVPVPAVPETAEPP